MQTNCSGIGLRIVRPRIKDILFSSAPRLSLSCVSMCVHVCRYFSIPLSTILSILRRWAKFKHRNYNDSRKIIDIYFQGEKESATVLGEIDSKKISNDPRDCEIKKKKRGKKGKNIILQVSYLVKKTKPSHPDNLHIHHASHHAHIFKYRLIRSSSPFPTRPSPPYFSPTDQLSNLSPSTFGPARACPSLSIFLLFFRRSSSPPFFFFCSLLSLLSPSSTCTAFSALILLLLLLLLLVTLPLSLSPHVLSTRPYNCRSPRRITSGIDVVRSSEFHRERGLVLSSSPLPSSSSRPAPRSRRILLSWPAISNRATAAQVAAAGCLELSLFLGTREFGDRFPSLSSRGGSRRKPGRCLLLPPGG